MTMQMVLSWMGARYKENNGVPQENDQLTPERMKWFYLTNGKRHSVHY